MFFFLQDGDRAWVWIFQAASDQNRERITEAGDNALGRVGGYLRGTTVLASIMAVTDYAFMWLLGVPLAVPLTILVFFSAYIPYFGGFVANLVLLGVTYGALGAGPAIALLALIAVRNVVLAYGVRPAVYGRTVHLHPALVLVALPVGSSWPASSACSPRCLSLPSCWQSRTPRSPSWIPDRSRNVPRSSPAGSIAWLSGRRASSSPSAWSRSASPC